MKKIYISLLFIGTFFASTSKAQVTYNDVAGIFYSNCTGCHHAGGAAPIPLMNFNDCSTNTTDIAADLNSGKMPPWLPDTTYGNVRFLHEQIISLADKNLILQWINEGAVEGDTALAPDAPYYDDYAYKLCPEPTMILKMAPYTLQHDEGHDCFVLPTNLPANRYLRAFEIVPGNASIVKSVFAGFSIGGVGLVDDTTGNCLLPIVTGYLGNYSPNAAPTVWPGKAPLRCGMLIPANAELNLQIHYAEGSLGQSDSTEIRLYFYPDTATNVRKITTTVDINNFLIYSFPNTVTTLRDSLFLDSSRSILGIYPNAHGVTTNIEVKGFKSTPEIPLIKINNWDKDWSSFYFYKKLVKFPVPYYFGATSTLDNTTSNPNNPNNPPEFIAYSASDTGEVQYVATQWLRYLEGDEFINIDSLLQCDTLLVCRPGAAGTILGSSTICSGQTGATFSVPDVANAATYAWSYSGTGATITGTGTSISIDFSLSATGGELTVYGVNECGVAGAVSSGKTLTITNGSPVGAAGTITGDTIACNNQAGIAYTVPVITGATDYAWMYSGTGVTITGTSESVTIDFSDSATSGNLTVMGKNTCNNGVVSNSFAIVVFPIPAVPTIIKLEKCGYTQLIASSSTGGYLWSPGGETTQSIDATTDGSYYVKVTSGGSCSATSIVETITVIPLPTITNSVDGTRCDVGTVVLSATASTGLPTWYANATGGTALATATSYTTTSLSTTTIYYVDATENSCTSARVAVIAEINNGPTATISGDGSVCSGNNGVLSIALTGTAPWDFTYESSVGSNPVTGITTATYTVAAAAETYSLSAVSDASGCSALAIGNGSVTISQNNAITVTTETLTCSGGFYTVEFDIAGGDPASYVVNGDAGTLVAAHFTSGSIASGVAYSFDVTDAANCASVPVNGQKTCGCAATAIIAGGGGTCNGSVATINVTFEGAAPWRFTYAIDGASQAEINNVTVSPYTFTTTVVGSYTLDSVYDANCLGSISGTATVSATGPTATISGGGSVCTGDSTNLVFDLTSGTPPWSFTYSDGTTTSPLITSQFVNQPISVTVAGIYRIVSMSSGSCNGTGADSAVVIVNALPTIAVTASPSTSICTGAEVVLNGTGANTYVWTDGVVDGEGAIVIANTTYTVTGTDTNGCVNTAVQAIETIGVPTITPNALPSSAAVCAGSSVTLTGSASGVSSFTWTGGVIDGQAFEPTATTTYTVTGVGPTGCAGTASRVVSVFPLPIVSITVTPSATVCSGETVTLSGSGTDSYIWSDNVVDGVAFTPTATTTYNMIGKDAFNCQGTASQLITVDPCNGGVGIEEATAVAQTVIIYPNPNNGFFNIVVKNADFKALEMIIINVLGEIVYTASDVNNATDYQTEVNLEHLPKGIYYLKLNADSNTTIEKLIIQ